jgi:hypothetical protein
LKPGVTETEVAALADYCARRAGCQEVEFLVFTNDDRAPPAWSHEHFPFRPPADTLLHPGSSVGLFIAIQYHGYWVEASQSMIVDKSCNEQRDAYQLALGCFEEMMRGMVPAADADDSEWHDGVRFRWVHGTGLDREEAPFVSGIGEEVVQGDIVSAHVAVRCGGHVIFAGRPMVVSEARAFPLVAPVSLALPSVY